MHAEELFNRIRKRFSFLKKWGKREGVTCFRVYERDLPDFPLILDWMDGVAIVWIYDRKKDETEVLKREFETIVREAVLGALKIDAGDLYLKSRGIQKGLDTQYGKLSRERETKIVEEGGLRFELNLTDYLDTGLFLDHRNTRAMCRDMSNGKRVLNLFAYTGAFTCYAIDGGASATTTVDLNANYIEWAKRNLVLNGFQNRGTDRFIVDNCLSFVKLEAGRGRYDLIVCDPPTFSNSKKMKYAFNVDEDYVDLLKACLKLLAPGGVVIFSTNSRSFKLDSGRFPAGVSVRDISHRSVPEDFRNRGIHRAWVFG